MLRPTDCLVYFQDQGERAAAKTESAVQSASTETAERSTSPTFKHAGTSVLYDPTQDRDGDD